MKNPQDVVKLVEGGVPIKKVNIGNMHMAEGKRQVAGVVAVDDADVAAFRRLQELGVELEIQKVPTEGKEDVFEIYSNNFLFIKGVNEYASKFYSNLISIPCNFCCCD